MGISDNAFSALGRFEEKVAREEATAKAFDQLASAGKDDDLEKQFAQLGDHSVDAELAATPVALRNRDYEEAQKQIQSAEDNLTTLENYLKP